MDGKILITSGCSFSECVTKTKHTWPIALHTQLSKTGTWEHKSSAMGSQGNGLISRGLIYNVTRALEEYNPENILVGVMWSGATRHDFYYDEADDLNFVKNRIHGGWVENPTGFIPGHQKNWVILNHNWSTNEQKNLEAKLYYKHFYTDKGHIIYSIEHILRTQWFLKQNRINYFFTDFTKNNILFEDSLKDDPEIGYLWRQIDRVGYLPVESEYTWLKDNRIFIEDFSFKEDWETHSYIHPSKRQHAEFVDAVIVPWLKDRAYI